MKKVSIGNHALLLADLGRGRAGARHVHLPQRGPILCPAPYSCKGRRGAASSAAAAAAADGGGGEGATPTSRPRGARAACRVRVGSVRRRRALGASGGPHVSGRVEAMLGAACGADSGGVTAALPVSSAAARRFGARRARAARAVGALLPLAAAGWSWRGREHRGRRRGLR